MANIFGKLFDWDDGSMDENGNVLMPANPPPVVGASGGGLGGASGGAGNIVFAGTVPTQSTTYTVGASTASWSNVYTTAAASTWSTTFSDDLVISRPNKEPIKVAETLEKIMERLAILQPNFEQMEKFPALKAAYDNYKLIEALCHEDETTKDED